MPIFVEQNRRAQFWHNESDRALLEEAWELTGTHRRPAIADWAAGP